MSHWSASNDVQSVLYAQNCPEEPLILQRQTIVQQQPFQEVKHSVKQTKSKIAYQPHIITLKKGMQGSVKAFQDIEHQRQLSILQVRIRNCKSLTQRKKDPNDPILYPAYFIRSKKRCMDARIDGYFRKIANGVQGKPLKKKQPRKHIKNRQVPMKLQQQYELTRQSFWKQQPREMRFTRSNFPLPPVTHQEPYRRKIQQNMLNMPQADSQSIANFIMDRRMFLEDDLRILKARMVHNFGEGIDKQWREALYFVLRSRPS